MKDQKDCQHEQFEADVAVGRISEVEGGPITHYTADVKIKCIECGLPFEFIGMPAGMNRKFPTTNVDFTEAHLPIRPYSNSVATKLSYQVGPDQPIKHDA